MGSLEWAGLPVRTVLIEPRYQVVVDEVGIGEVGPLIAPRMVRWEHYESRQAGYARSRRRAIEAILGAHSKAVDRFADPEATDDR